MAVRCLALIVAVLSLALQPAAADDVEDFYRGKSVTLIVGYGPGGGFDTFARLLARHIGQCIPGTPAIIVQNMPGAGSLVATNYLYNLAPKDGTVFGLIARNIPLVGLIGDNRNFRFDPRKFNWLGSTSDYSKDAYVLIVRKGGPIRSIEEAIRPGGPTLTLGGTAAGGGSNDVPRILREALGLRVHLIAGYPDSAALNLAIENREINGRTIELSSVRASKPGWLAPDGEFKVLLQYARATRHEELPDVPTARELALNDAARSFIAFTESPFAMAWPYAAPPGVPARRIEALQTAFEAVHRNAKFVAESEAMGGEVSFVDAKELAKRIDSVSKASPELVEQMKVILAVGGR